MADRIITADELLKKVELDLSDPKTIESVWKKGLIDTSLNPDNWRVDIFGARIKRTERGNRKSSYGWEIDHIITKKDGGKDILSNLRPLQWENNVKRNQKKD